ncbi:MAG: glycerophosphodiester phosphodiesterase [Candidatus Hydrogenedentota bacterium]
MRNLIVAFFVLVAWDAASATYACAHRGDKASAPENTIPAFASAVEKGAAMIEFDVHLTTDDRLVIMHDSTVDRTTDGTGKVAEMTFEEIRALDAGSWFDAKFAGARAPTLREALEAIPEHILCNVHCKTGPDIAPAAARVIADMDRLAQCFLACSVDQIAEARAAVPEIMTCNMSRQMGDRTGYIETTIALGAEFIQLHKRTGYENIAAHVERLHAAGVRVNWCCDDSPETIEELAEAGVDYILTDDLDTVLAVLAP